MMAKAAIGQPRDTYLELVQQFPLKVIRNDDHLREAVDHLNGLLARELDTGGEEYVDVLTELVRLYEEEHYPMPDVSEADMLRHLLDARGVNQAAVAQATGIAPSTLSAILTGSRKMSRSHIQKLAEYFRVQPGVFLPRVG